jgi:hypothetical protein
MTKLENARLFARHGAGVILLHGIDDNGKCTCRGNCEHSGKHPATNNGVDDATTDDAAIVSLLTTHPHHNYGIACDRVVVVDIDRRGAVDGMRSWRKLLTPTTTAPPTWTVRTGGNGLHVIYKQPDPPLGNVKLAAGVDLKGSRGYIVGVGSRHVSGNDYVWFKDCGPENFELAPCPEWLAATCSAGTRRRTSTAEWQALAASRHPEGTRTNAICRIAGHLLANPWNDPVEVRELMLGYNRGQCVPPLPDGRVIEIVEDFAGKELRKVGGN